LLTAGLELHAAADDRGDVLAHVGREHILTYPFPVDVLGKLDQFIVGLNLADGHGGSPFL
jgi:hypothetical protein